MARIVIRDLPRREEISQEEMCDLRGGGAPCLGYIGPADSGGAGRTDRVDNPAIRAIRDEYLRALKMMINMD